MRKAFLSLGTNLGERDKNLAKAIRYINMSVGHIIDLSGIYETEPWGFESDTKFLNMVVEIITDLTPHELLANCKDIENKLGRDRSMAIGYSSRIIDIDILFYEKEIVSDPDLVLPHPHIQSRRFILEPLAEIAPEFVHPQLNLTTKQLLADCIDEATVVQLGTLTQGF